MAVSCSLVVPCFNRERYVGATIGSILRQTHEDFELVIWDDGSTDRSAEVAEEAARGDSRVRVVRAQHRGVAASLNAAVRELHGQYIGWVDSDDALAPKALERTVAVLERRPKVGMVYTRYLVMNENGDVLGHGKRSVVPYSRQRLLTTFMTFHFRLMRREVFELVGGLDETLDSAEDYDLCLKLSEVTDIEHVAEALYLYRVHDDSHSQARRVEQIHASRDVIQRALERRGLADRYEAHVEIVGRYELRPKPSARTDKVRVVHDFKPMWELLGASTASPVRDHGLVSCLCVTRGIHAHLQRAVACFQAQTYPRRELVIVYEELDEDATRLLAERIDGVVLVHVPPQPKQPLGVLRNASLAAAQGDFVCNWDDDDWHAPRRLELELEALAQSEADACVLNRWLVFDEVTRNAYVSGKRLWEGSLLCRRDLEVLKGGYPARKRGEDHVLILAMKDKHRIATLDRPELYIYTYHRKNTWDREHFERIFASATELSQADSSRIEKTLLAK
ncbi:MAG TPA: glycosyltransferase [Polyangiaceae bacterium]